MLAVVERFIIPSVDIDYPGLRVYRPAPGGGPEISLLVQAQGVSPDQGPVILLQHQGGPGLSCPPHCHTVPGHLLQNISCTHTCTHTFGYLGENSQFPEYFDKEKSGNNVENLEIKRGKH